MLIKRNVNVEIQSRQTTRQQQYTSHRVDTKKLLKLFNGVVHIVIVHTAHVSSSMNAFQKPSIPSCQYHKCIL